MTPILPTEEQDVCNRYCYPDKHPGFLRKMFGSPQNTPTNIAGFVVCILLATLCVLIFVRIPGCPP